MENVGKVILVSHGLWPLLALSQFPAISWQSMDSNPANLLLRWGQAVQGADVLNASWRQESKCQGIKWFVQGCLARKRHRGSLTQMKETILKSHRLWFQLEPSGKSWTTETEKEKTQLDWGEWAGTTGSSVWLCDSGHTTPFSICPDQKRGWQGPHWKPWI